MRYLTFTLALALAPMAATAQDAAAGETVFGKCKACHRIESGNEVIAKGGRVGPNLWNVIGRQVSSLQDFNYGPGMQALLPKNIIWDEAMLIEYLADPMAWVKKMGEDDSLKSKMTFKLTKPEDAANVAAYLKSLSPDAPAAAPATP
jgi:cytochrome c